MRFSDFLLVSDPADLDYIVGYAGDQNIRIDVADFVADYISGSGTPGYVPVFTAANVIGDSVVFQHGTNIVIGGVNSLGYKLAVSGSLYASNGAVINSTVSGADALRVIGGDGDIFVIPNDLGQPISSLRRINHPPAVLTTESATLGQLNSAISTLEGDIEILLDLKVDKTSVGVPNGVASLDAGGKVPLSQIPDSIIGQVQYMGTWNALTNTPTLNFLVPEEKGHYYVVSVAGVFGGIDFQVGDWIISNGTYWEKVDNTDAVTSVFGRIGAILALEADYQSFYPRLSQAYDNPTWINTIAFSKITGVPPFLLENQTITLSGDVTGSGKTSISTTISDNAVTDSKLRNSVGTSVIGRASSTTGDPADIQATTDGHVLLRSGGNLLFGLISSDSIGSIDWSKITNTPTTLSGYGITNAYTKTEADNKFVPYTGANANVNLGSNNITANSFIKAGGTSAQFLKADGSVDTSQYVPTTRSINAGTGLTGGGNLSSDVNIAFDTTWGDTRYAYRTRQLTINGTTYDLSADRIWNVGTVTSVGLSMPSAFTVSNSPVIGAGVLTVVGAGTILEYVRGDGSLATFPSLTGYVPYTGATQDVNLGTYGLISDFVRFNPSSSNIPSAEGVMWWDNTDGTVRLSVKGNTYSVPIGQSVISRVRNSTGGNLLRTNYQVVKVAGAQGQRLAVSLAQANNDLNSASTLGLVCEDISNNQEGFIVNIGQIVNVNTTGNLQGETWNDGDVLYLSPTIAGAITNIKPVAPQHTVILGYVEYAHANNGKIYVKIDNGYELEELHDVSAEPFINNGLLYRDTTLNLWKSATISTILGYTPAPQGNYITSLTGEATASGPGAASVTLSNSAVTGKVLTGLNIAGNEILSTDSILTAFGKLQHQVNQLVGGLQYEGTWNASTNTPTITSSVGTDGTFYIVSVAGTTNINGITDWQVGDWIVFHDTAWQKVDNSDSVSSVFGRVGNIVANQADYSAFYPLIADIKNGVLTVQGTGVLSGSGTFSANQATNNTISLIHSAISRTDTTSTQTPSFGGSFNVIDSVTSSAEGHITAIDTKTVTIPSTVASASQTGLLSSADWITFNSKQNAITLTTTGTSGPATLVGATLNIPNYAPDLSGYVTLGTDQTITGLKTIVRSGDVLNFKIGTDTLYGLKLFYSQNELVPSGEATWSFVNTFNRNGVGYETTPISFFRGVLVTGERLLSASINSNLLDYYGNNPSGRYPVYAYNTGVQQFSTGIIVGKTTGVVNAATGAIADLPAGVVANFNGRVIGGNAVNSNEFVTLIQLGSYVPTSRTLTINGVSYDLSADRSWTITAGVSGVTATSPLFSSGGSTPNITIQQASGSQSGFLSSTDWTTFNNKQNALTNPVTGTGTTNYLAKFTGTSSVGNSAFYDGGGFGGFNSTGIGSRTFVINAASGRPLALEIVEFANIHSVYVRPNNSGYNLISSNYISGGVYLPLSLSARENSSDLVLATSGNLLVGTTTDVGSPYRLQVNGRIQLYGAELIFSGDENKSINVFSNRSLSLSTNDTARLTITGGGNVGIGTNNPDSQLTLNGSSNSRLNMRAGETRYGTLYADNGVFAVASITAIPLVLGTNDVEAMRITSGRNVLIGTTSDNGARLNVQTSGSAVGGIRLTSATNTNGSAFVASNAGGDSYFGRNSSTGGAFTGAAYATVVYGGGNYPMGFYTNDTERMRITSDGNVGIGTTSPINGGGDSKWITLEGNSYGGGFISSVGGTAKGYLYFDNGTSTFAMQAASGVGVSFLTSNTERARITTSGNLLVGTTTDGGYKLDVNGTGRFSSNLYTSTALYISTTAAYGFKINSEGNNGFYNRGGSTNAHYPFLLENSSGSLLFQVQGNGAATFSSSVTASGLASKGTTLNNNNTVRFLRADNTEMGYIGWSNENTNNSTWLFKSSNGNPIAFSPDGVNQEVIFNTDGSAFFNYPVLGSRSFVFRTVSGRPLTLETVALTGIHSLYLRPNDSGRHLISSNYLSGGAYLPLALSGRENDSDLVLGTNGNVLIGTTSDAGYKLNVNGNAYANTLTLGYVGLNISDYNFYSQTISGAMGILGHNVRASSSVANQVDVVNGGWYSSMIKMYYSEGITFHTSLTSYSAGAVYPMAGTERMRITSGGNVGIGTNSPNALLDLQSSNAQFVASFSSTKRLGISRLDTYSRIDSFTNGIGYDILSLNPDGGNVLIGTITDNGNRLRVNGVGYFDQGVRTGQPVGTTTNNWLLGRALISGTSTPNRWIRVQIGLEYYDILAVYMGTL